MTAHHVTIAIVGGGPSGLTAAAELASRVDGEVLVIEREAETGGIPCAGRCGELGAAAPALRSAVKATITTDTPGIARTAASASARTPSQALTSDASTLIEKNTLSPLTAISDRALASVNPAPRGDMTLLRRSRTCCRVTLKFHLQGWRKTRFGTG